MSQRIRIKRQAPSQGSRIRISGAGQRGNAIRMRRIAGKKYTDGPKVSISQTAPHIRNFRTGATPKKQTPVPNNSFSAGSQPPPQSQQTTQNIYTDTHHEMDVPGDETNLDFLMNPETTNEHLLSDKSDNSNDSNDSSFSDQNNDDDKDNESEIGLSDDNSDDFISNDDNHESTYKPPPMSHEQIRMKKEDLLYQFSRMREKGINVHRFTMNDRLDDMQAEYNRQIRRKKLENFNTVAKNALITSLTVLEWSNNVYDPFSLKLDGWSAAVQDDLEASNNQYEEVFEELYDKYADKAQMAPELKLCMLLGFSAMTHHLTQQRFANFNGGNSRNTGNGGSNRRYSPPPPAAAEQQRSDTPLDRFANQNNGYIPPGGMSVRGGAGRPAPKMDGPGSDIERGLNTYLPQARQSGGVQTNNTILLSASSASSSSESD